MSAPTLTKPGKTRTYAFTALDASGKRQKGTVEAATDGAAASTVRSQGLTPLTLAETGRGLQKEITIPGFGGRVKLKDLAIFSRQFSTMTSSGLSLLRSLAILEEQTPNQVLATATRDVRKAIEGGKSLSTAMAEHKKVFPRLMISMVAAGETGGFLDKALDRIAVNFEKDAELKAKIKSAMTYPVIVICFSVLMLIGVLLFIVPVFEKMFKNLGATLPLPTQVLVTASHQAGWLVPLTLITFFGGTAWLRRKLQHDETWQLKFDQLKLRLPVFGKLLTKIAISRFARNLGTLLAVGVPVMQALDIVGRTTGNLVINSAMKDVAKAVRDGQPMSAPLAHHDIFPSMVVQMVEVGEESGQISAMLDKVSDFYDQEVAAATESLTSALEPVMVVVMGALIGAMVICLYLPMFTVYQHISAK